MSGFNALAARLARSRRKLERERALDGAARAGAGEPREAAVIAAAALESGTTNVIQFPRR
jgi:hypothetical protein